jgi:hypothetical protein
MSDMTTVFTACGWNGHTARPEWDILALNSYERPGRVSAVCSQHLAERLAEYYEGAASQREIWAWAVPYDPTFVDDYERDGEYGE